MITVVRDGAGGHVAELVQRQAGLPGDLPLHVLLELRGLLLRRSGHLQWGFYSQNATQLATGPRLTTVYSIG